MVAVVGAGAMGAGIAQVAAAAGDPVKLLDTRARAAEDVVNQGVCDARGADSAMRLDVNYPCGPLAWADAVGLPAIRQVLTSLGQAYGEDRYRVSPLIQHHVFAKRNFHD
ncbi:MAG: 3-hydroxyacyl-CoA dehydrogenase family protein [Lacisediminimonas sp.]|nr:3-hydroxyacyl-CoA dehydrogenase family protein [Lacisediminimonas sp.]